MILDINTKPVQKTFDITHFHSAHNYSWNDDFVFFGESHDFWEMVCVISGSIQETEDSTVYTLKDGDVIFHAPMEFHSLKCNKDIKSHVLVISFSVNGDLPENMSDGIFSLTCDEINAYQKIFNQIHTLIHGEDEDAFLSTECSYHLGSYLLSLSANHKTNHDILLSRSAKAFNEVVNLMNERIDDNLSLSDFAKLNNISISQLKVLFGKFAGISPKLYYAKLRCNRCMKLLRDGVSSSEISSTMNFSSPGYFSVFFKNITGVTPTEYIKNL